MSSILATRSEFDTCLQRFLKESNACPTEIFKWQIETSPSIIKLKFLKREINTIVSQADEESYGDELMTSIDMHNMDDEDAASLFNNQVESNPVSIHLEQHIVYSASYQVPVLYFKAVFGSNGAPLSLNDIHQYIVPKSRNPLHTTTPVVVSQNEHPVLGTPFWYIHPCDTSTLMRTLTFQPEDYIKTWLSVYGPLVKCPISMDMFKDRADAKGKKSFANQLKKK
ncbi:autophagocytosis associated protein [Mycotypha africana]|uniref:autophagocytosis associated protein n=1 Tax=Mycotypha africana TaxID=64632 RepID=UPI0023017520|nr:autophagocytosis associated protein [Mycotypha africana]KAI8968177.1 autophagocytosis associated protein [Mycotypha africana]